MWKRRGGESLQNSPTLHFPLSDYKTNINTNTSPQIMETKPLLNNPTNPPFAAGRRDEWSEGAVACLLDSYESKWELRSRAKLKGRDWDDVARRVSGRAGGARSAKTPSQCKNKIESMKKRYRSESASAVAGGCGVSRWPFFGRIQRLMTWKNDGGGVLVLEGSPAAAPAAAVPIGDSPEMNGGVGAGKEPLEGKGENNENNQAQMDSMHDKPTNDAYKEKEDIEKNKKMNKKKKKKKKKKKRKLQEKEEDDFEVIESIQSLVGTTLKIEQLRMETMRDVEKIWAQAEAKKGEIDLKRTEVIAKTQLKIAKLFYKSTG